MKLEKIKFNNHEKFNNLEIDFKDSNGKILDTIVIIGENGSGKTTLLNFTPNFQNIVDQNIPSFIATKILSLGEK